MNLFVTVIGSLLLIGVANGASGKGWGYLYGDKNILPENWGQQDAKCDGKVQSPINVISDATVFDDKIGPIEIRKTGGSPNGSEMWKVENNGHTVKYTPLNSEFQWVMYPQQETFKLLQLHFHWRGSEHIVDHHKFAGEVHLVTQSITNKEQYSVVGFLIKMVDEDNKAMRPLIEQMPQIRIAEAKINSTAFRLRDIVPMNVKDFFRYTGSLTTPSCDEIVEWNLANSPVLTLSENQLVQLQTLLDKNGDAILTNSRPIQPIGDRMVRRSFNPFDMHKPVERCQPRRRRAQC